VGTAVSIASVSEWNLQGIDHALMKKSKTQAAGLLH